MTPGQHWRCWRDLAICQLRAGGWTYRRIAYVFDLPHSRAVAIVARAGDDFGRDRACAETRPGGGGATATRRAPRAARRPRKSDRGAA